MLAATTIFLFALLTGAPSDRPSMQILYRTTSLATCQAQADAWNKQLSTDRLRAVCLPHSQKALVSNPNNED